MVLFRNGIAGAVRRKPDFYRIPHVCPPGVVVRFFRCQGYARHKTKRLAEIAKLKLFKKPMLGFLPHKEEI